MKRGIKKYALFFLLGAIGYAAIEIIFRGHTHWSMMIAGGICFLLFSVIDSKLKNRSILTKALVCGFAVTGVEFIFGLIFNLWLGLSVWDYSYMPFNLLGQICPTFTLIWAGIALAFLPFVEVLNLDYAD